MVALLFLSNALNNFYIRFIFLNVMVECLFFNDNDRDRLFLLVLFLVYVKAKASKKIGTLTNLSIYSHRTSLGDNAAVRIGLLPLTSLLQFDFLNLSVDDLFHKCVSILILILIVISLTLIGKDHIGLLRASCILDSVLTSDSFSVLYDMMLSRGIFHRNQSPCW
jgi:hypothetical protein